MTTIYNIIIRSISISHQDIFQDNHHHSLHNIFNDFKYIYQYRGSHVKIKYELYPITLNSMTPQPTSITVKTYLTIKHDIHQSTNLDQEDKT